MPLNTRVDLENAEEQFMTSFAHIDVDTAENAPSEIGYLPTRALTLSWVK